MEFKELIAAFAAKYAIEGLDGVDDVVELDVDGSRVELLDDQQTRSVVVCTEIGQPPPDANGEFGAMMLKANFMLRATDGATLCQNPETGAYALVRQRGHGRALHGDAEGRLQGRAGKAPCAGRH